MGLVHPSVNKHIGLSEAKRLASFPDMFLLQGSLADQWACIGNSVPPMFMKAIADHIWQHILQPLKLPI
jgi:Site-specific DNA methylase